MVDSMMSLDGYAAKCHLTEMDLLWAHGPGPVAPQSWPQGPGPKPAAQEMSKELLIEKTLIW